MVCIRGLEGLGVPSTWKVAERGGMLLTANPPLPCCFSRWDTVWGEKRGGRWEDGASRCEPVPGLHRAHALGLCVSRPPSWLLCCCRPPSLLIQ